MNLQWPTVELRVFGRAKKVRAVADRGTSEGCHISTWHAVARRGRRCGRAPPAFPGAETLRGGSPPGQNALRAPISTQQRPCKPGQSLSTAPGRDSLRRPPP
jgi:hypothetical protein